MTRSNRNTSTHVNHIIALTYNSTSRTSTSSRHSSRHRRHRLRYDNAVIDGSNARFLIVNRYNTRVTVRRTTGVVSMLRSRQAIVANHISALLRFLKDRATAGDNKGQVTNDTRRRRSSNCGGGCYEGSRRGTYRRRARRST